MPSDEGIGEANIIAAATRETASFSGEEEASGEAGGVRETPSGPLTAAGGWGELRTFLNISTKPGSRLRN